MTIYVAIVATIMLASLAYVAYAVYRDRFAAADTREVVNGQVIDFDDDSPFDASRVW